MRRREEHLEKTRRAVTQRLKREISYWDHRAAELKEKEDAGKTPRLNSTMARQRADELEARLKHRLDLLDRERQLSAAPPHVVGGALVIPQGLLDQLRHVPEEDRDLSPDERRRIDRLAVQAVLDAERRLGRQPTEMPHHHEGYDIESTDPHEPGRLRFIEVKGKARGKDTVTVSATQIRTCCNQRDRWILALVQVDGDTASEPRYLYGPFDQAPGFAEVGRNLSLRDLLAQSQPPS